jgi:hypothetical protein
MKRHWCECTTPIIGQRVKNPQAEANFRQFVLQHSLPDYEDVSIDQLLIPAHEQDLTQLQNRR